MTREVQSILGTSRILWAALRNHQPDLEHIIQLGIGALMSSFSVKGCTKSWEAYEHNQRFGENDSIDIGKSQTLRKEGNARIKKLSAIRQSLGKEI